jgi:hypothetical protein
MSATDRLILLLAMCVTTLGLLTLALTEPDGHVRPATTDDSIVTHLEDS